MKRLNLPFRILVIFCLLLTQMATSQPVHGSSEEQPPAQPVPAPAANGTPPITVQDITYVYTPDGQIQSLSDSERTTTQTSSTESWSYTYDAAQRLTRAQASGGQGGNFDRIYSYDSYGEAEVNDNGFSLNYDFLARDSGESANGYYKPFHAVDRVSDDASGAVLFSYRYDAAGNMTKRYTTTPAKTETFGYDAENRLTSYGDGSATGVSFFYDDQGSMIRKKVDTGSNPTTRITYYVGNYYEYVTDGSGNAISTSRYYYAGAQRIAMRQGSGEMQFFAGNHLGSTETVFSAAGTVSASMRYNPFGGTRYVSAGGFPSAYQYTGQRAIGEVGLIYFNARWEDPYINRWTQPDSIIQDPYNPQDFDRYSYVRNDPINHNDPSGHSTACLEGDVCKPSAHLPVLFKLESGGKNFSLEEGTTIGVQTWRVAAAEAKAINSQNRKFNYSYKHTGDELIPNVTTADAFLSVHDGPIIFTRSTETRKGYVGQTIRRNQITIYDLMGANCGCLVPNYLIDHPNVVIHEIGHAIDLVDGNWGVGLPGNLANNRKGFAGGMNDWQFGGDQSEEIFADMVVGWVNNQWGRDAEGVYFYRANWMKINIGSILLSR